MCPKDCLVLKIRVAGDRVVYRWQKSLVTGRKGQPGVHMKCFSPNSVNIHFHMLWLATQTWDIHWISTGLQNTMHACMSNSISSCQFWQDKINVFVAGFLLVRYILLNNYSPQCWWIMLDIYLTIHFHFLNNWFAKQNGCTQVFLSL